MKLKTVELNGVSYAELQDGKPLFVKDDGSEVAIDVPSTVQNISRLNGEAKTHREAKEAAEARLRAFEGIEDPEAARKAIETIRNIDAGQLVAAGKVQEIKDAAARAANEQVANVQRQSQEALNNAETTIKKLEGQYYDEKVGGAFVRSKFIGDKIAIPVELMRSQFGGNFKVEEGSLRGYDQRGQLIYDPAKPGEPADFDAALSVLVNQSPFRDAILKGSGSSGSGAGPSRGGAGAGQMSRGEFDRLAPAAKQNLMREGKTQIVDA